MNQKLDSVIDNFLIQKLIFFIIIFFFSMGYFSYDFEIIIVSSILVFIIFFYYNFSKVLYYFFFSKKNNLGIEYINYIINKHNVQIILKKFCDVLLIKEQFFIESLFYIYSFLRTEYLLSEISRIIFILYLFKEKLIFFFKQFSFVSKLKNTLINFLKFYVDFIFFIFLIKLFSENLNKNIFDLFLLNNIEVYDVSTKNFIFLISKLNYSKNSIK
jgi:hypothetical protein